MPRLALQYRLCEVGTDRLEHEVLRFHLELAVRTGDITTAQGTFENPDRRGAKGLNESTHPLQSWGLADHGQELDELNLAIEDILVKRKFEVHRTPETDHSRKLDVQTRNGPATIMLVVKESAITLNDQALWEFLIECALRERQPYILARSVSKATFPVLKALGARAFQFYFIPLPAGLAEEEAMYQTQAKKLGLPPVLLTTEWSAHPVNDLLIKQLSENQPGMQSVAARQAIMLASERGFDKAAVGPKKTRRWASDIETRYAIKLPQSWSAMMKHWTELEQEFGSAHETDS